MPPSAGTGVEKRSTLDVMLFLLSQGQYVVFVMILAAIVMSLSFHEFGHAASAKALGDDTAERAGRLTLNPIAHIDPIGLLMVVFVGFGYARPVPVNPANLKSEWGNALVAFAGPFMNFVIALVAVNLLVWGVDNGVEFLSGAGARTFLSLLASINILLMLFNLIPLGPLDGHYILPRFLPRNAALRYEDLNLRYGTYLFLGLIALSIAGVPVFRALLTLSYKVLELITFV